VDTAYQGQAGADRPTSQVRLRARDVVADVSLLSLGDLEPLCEALGQRLLEDFPAFGQDAELEGEMHAAIHANLYHVFEHVMPTGAEEALAAPPEALRFAASVLHRGIDTADLIQAYRVGQNLAWSWWMERLAARLIGESEVLIEALQVSSQRMFSYVDAAIDQQVRLWEEERRRWLGRAVALRADAVRRVLHGDALPSEEVAQALDYHVERPLLAAVLWDEAAPTGAAEAAPADAEIAISQLEAVADAMALALGANRALLVPAGACSLWAWFPTERHAAALDLLAAAAASHIQDGQGIALGLPGSGIEGFRSSHRQALRARRLAELGDAPAGVIRFDHVDTLCLLVEDPELIADFMRRKLGGLASMDPGIDRLRENVLVWFREGCNSTRAASHMHTHKNTVLYRLQKAEEALGHPLDDDRLGLELALTLADRFGLGMVGG
jgi:DNA-binding PucR family transcriptional regulator